MEKEVVQKDTIKSEPRNNTFAVQEKEDMLKFAQKLEVSDNAFLIEFAEFLKIKYHGDKPVRFRIKTTEVEKKFLERAIPEVYKNQPNKKEYSGDQRVLVLEDFVEEVYYFPIMLDSFMNKGCALFGETPFDKLEFVKTLLEVNGVRKYVNDGIVQNSYVIIDWEGKAKKPWTLEVFAQKYKDVFYVIFNNCENILEYENNLVLFKHLCETNRKITTVDGDWIAKSRYILLGNKMSIHKKLEDTNYSSFNERFRTFSHFIHLFEIE